MDLILRALDIQVAASREEVRIDGSVPALVPQEADLVTIVQTSGCWSNQSVKDDGEGLGFNNTISKDLEPFRRQLIRFAA